MSKERYPDQARIVQVAETFRKERFPLDYIVQDWQYWGSDTDGSWSGMTWDPVRFPNPQAMAARIHQLNLKLMVSIWPSVGNDTALARELDQYGLRFEPLHWISKKARIYDAYSSTKGWMRSGWMARKWKWVRPPAIRSGTRKISNRSAIMRWATLPATSIRIP
jgi:hypothetical protein